MSINQRTTAAKVTAELSIYLKGPVSTKTVRRELRKSNIHVIAEIAKLLLTESKAKMRKIWCGDHKTRTSDDWKHVIWSVGSSFSLFQTSGPVYICRNPKLACTPECLVSTLKYGGGSVKIWATTSWYFGGHIITMNGRITDRKYVDILGNQVHHKVQALFPNNYAIFQDDNSPIYTARILILDLMSKKIHFNTFSGQHNSQA